VFVLLLLSFKQPDPPTGCVVDRCEDDFCIIETPEGWAEVSRKTTYYEGKEVACPMWAATST